MNNYREYLERIKAGEKGLNPFLDFLDIKLTDLKDGFAEFRMKVRHEYLQGAKIMQGGLVVADLFCTGSNPGFAPVETNGEPIRALAEHTFKKTMCPRMMEDFDRRLKQIVAEQTLDIQALKAALIAGAETAIASGDHRSAVIQLKSALQKNAGNREARQLLGTALLETGAVQAGDAVELVPGPREVNLRELFRKRAPGTPGR